MTSIDMILRYVWDIFLAILGSCSQASPRPGLAIRQSTFLPHLAMWPKGGYSWQTDLVEAILSERGAESAYLHG